MNLILVFAVISLIFGGFIKMPILCLAKKSSVVTSIAKMATLISVERELIDHLESYVQKLESRAKLLRSVVNEMSEENSKASRNAEDYLSNPLNSFSLVRRLQSDWNQWYVFLRTPHGEDDLAAMRRLRSHLPSESDVTEAALAMQRLQETYDLKVNDMAEGILNDLQYEAHLTSLDCFAIGLELFKEHQNDEASMWLHEALRKYEASEIYEIFEYSKENIEFVYTEALLKQKNPIKALRAIDAALELLEGNVRLKRLRRDMKDFFAATNSRHIDSEPNDYQRGCRGEYFRTISNLHCRFHNSASPLLLLSPLKMEEINFDPFVAVFHDVISSEEIDHLKSLALPKLSRSTVLNVDGRAVVRERTSHLCLLADNATDVVERINRRIAAMTGFNLSGSERLQVVNYGVGGHYDLHFDFFNVTEDHEIVREQGNRIATVLIYLSDVAQGGATVFPIIKRAILPVKGSAVVWYNLMESGDEGDSRTKHAACPVLFGSKWAANKWIRVKNQIFTKPCPRL